MSFHTLPYAANNLEYTQNSIKNKPKTDLFNPHPNQTGLVSPVKMAVFALAGVSGNSATARL
jgi:hypothetical protein